MEYEKLTNPEHYKSHAVTVEPIFWCETPMLQKAHIVSNVGGEAVVGL